MADILVIKLSALGDFVQAFAPFQAIRAHHPGAKITLLTTKAYAGLAEALGLFDEVWIDVKPKPWHIRRLRALSKQLSSKDWDFVYDLQTSDRSSGYFRLIRGHKPSWSGIAKNCSHPHANPNRDFMHTMDRQAEQLKMAGIDAVPLADLSFADSVDVSRFDLPENYVVFVPGGAPTRPKKRWPVSSYVETAKVLTDKGLSVVAIGTTDESDVLQGIKAGCDAVQVLMGQTDFVDIIALGRRAVGAIGNDTGPMHLLSASGCASVVLFSSDSDPKLCAPRGRAVEVLQVDDLKNLSPQAALQAFDGLTGTA